MGFDALDSNTTGSDNGLASWTWRATGSLNTARYLHTATLLQNGMVLVAGGTGGVLPSAELYDPASRSWTATGSLNIIVSYTRRLATKRHGPCCRGTRCYLERGTV